MPAMVPVNCFHCDEPVDRPGTWRACIEGSEREMCCAGCKAVAEAIEAAGLSDYYRTRTQPARAATAADGATALDAWDDRDILARISRPAPAASGATRDDRNHADAIPRHRVADAGARAPDSGHAALREATLLVDGLRCGACVWLLEQTLLREPGVVDVRVQLAGERVHVRWDPERTPLSGLLAAIARVGYIARPFAAQEREQQIRRTSKALFRRLFIATLAMMQVMMYAFPSYIAAPGDIEPGHESLLRWASLLLTIPVVFYSATPFLAGAWRDLRARSPGMDVPVAIGILAAFAASVQATLTGRGEVWFDSVTMFVCLLLAARYLEWIARRRAGQAIDALTAGTPETVERLDPVTGAGERVPVTRLVPGDHFRVATGERVGVDARIVDGHTAIDASLLTGESRALTRAPGDEIPGGAINAGNPITALAVRASEDSAISTIERLATRAAAARPRLADLSGQVARIFVSALLLLAVAVWLVWMQIDPARATPIAIAVLVVSCPCALSMAVPAALAAATGTAIRRGMLIARPDALEQIARCTDVVFDKTGTLTEGRPQLVAIEALPVDPAATRHVYPADSATDRPAATDRVEADRSPQLDRDRILALCAALEAGQSHPLATVIRAAAADLAAPPAFLASDIRTRPGMGVEARIGRHRYRLGSRRWVAEWHPALGCDENREEPALVPAAGAKATPATTTAPTALPPVSSGNGPREPEETESSVWLVDELRPLARLHLRDRLRDEAAEVVAALTARGLRVHLLSGDRSEAVQSVARELGIERATGDATPADKLACVRALQAEGRRVLMVGDGINDAPVLAAADMSVAVGEATSLARTAAGIVLLDASLHGLPALHTLALRTRRVVRQNLGWALAYNSIAIPAAAFGWVPPWLAALGMTGSSLTVVLNALRLTTGARQTRTGRPATDRTASPDNHAWKPSTCSSR